MATNPDVQDILFFCEYINVAWGARYDGLFITRSGQVYRFGEEAGMPLPLFGPDQPYTEYLAWVSRQAVLENQVDPVELEQKLNLIAAAAQGEIATGVGTCDAGVRSYQAFRWTGGELQQIMLASLLDRQLTNQSPQAAELVKWLKRIWGVEGSNE